MPERADLRRPSFLHGAACWLHFVRLQQRLRRLQERICRACALANVSAATVKSAVNALARLGYLTVAPTKRYCAGIGGVGYGKNEYALNLSVLRKGYTRVSRDVFGYELTASAFVIYLAILMFQGGKNRAWPSIAKLQKATGAVCSTICAGLKLLRKLPTLLVQRFVKPDGAFAANCYQPATAFVSAPCEENAGEVRKDDRLISRLYSIIDALFSQGVQLFFGHVGVLRNLAIEVMTYLTIAFTSRERSNQSMVKDLHKPNNRPRGTDRNERRLSWQSAKESDSSASSGV